MFNHIYIEQDIREHHLTRQILSRYPQATMIECERYGEVFNRKAQNFRLQKLKPALILASKHRNHVLPIPAEYAIGAKENYYFSHMLNCLYDCRYCFLQGMYQSAHYVLFVNYTDFKTSLQHTIDANNNIKHFFSGYDCDSLALDPVTGFIDEFVPFFADNPNALLELRTKSTQIRSLLQHSALPNCVVAFSLSPENIVSAIEHKTPSLQKRLAAIGELQDAGWLIGLRFDPLIYIEGFEEVYADFFDNIFTHIKLQNLHSVTLGTFRLPTDYFRKIVKLYPDERLFAAKLATTEQKMMSYEDRIRQSLLNFCQDKILSYVPPELYFPCEDIK